MARCSPARSRILPTPPTSPRSAARIAASHPDVLFVSAYVNDGVALRKAFVAAHVPFVASIGTSSSYCMPEFGKRLGIDAVGLFASDKPDGTCCAPPRSNRPPGACSRGPTTGTAPATAPR